MIVIGKKLKFGKNGHTGEVEFIHCGYEICDSSGYVVFWDVLKSMKVGEFLDNYEDLNLNDYDLEECDIKVLERLGRNYKKS